MKNLMLKIQVLLRTIDGMRDTDIFLSPDAELIPETVKLPCIGIKDGQVTREQLMGNAEGLTLPVEIYVYDTLVRSDKSIISVFDITTAIHGKLADNLLDDYIREVTPGKETPIQILYREDRVILRKTLFYEYYREV